MYEFKHYSHIFFTTIVLIAFSALLSCVGTQTRTLSSHKVEVIKIKPPEGEYSVVAINKIIFTDSKWEYLSKFFYFGLIDQFLKLETFDYVLYPASNNISKSSIILAGNIHEVKRWKNMKISGTFKILRKDGLVLSEFDASEVYVERTSTDISNINKLMKAFGQTIAIRTTNWVNGKSLTED